ncbi:UL16-binding protein 1-like isoform 2-T2 [Hipposideros larvatus]
MVRTVGSQYRLLLLTWLLLPVCTWAARCVWARGDAPSLCYNFTITPNGQSWCEVQGHINGNPFFNYRCSSQKVEPDGPVAWKVNDTNIWKRQTQTLKDLVEELKMKLLDIKPEIIKTVDDFSLQGRMTCQLEANGCTSASWEFGFDGKRFLHIDPKNGTYRVDHSGGKQMKEKWEDDENLTMFLKSFPVGEYKRWNGTFSKYWNKKPQAPAPPTTDPATIPTKATTTARIRWILPVILFTVGILCCVIYRLLQMKSMSAPGPSSCK